VIYMVLWPANAACSQFFAEFVICSRQLCEEQPFGGGSALTVDTLREKQVLEVVGMKMLAALEADQMDFVLVLLFVVVQYQIGPG